MSSSWRQCSACKKDIKLSGKYYSCSVSTCKKHVYCSVDCWELHVPVLNHKSAWAEENFAPAVPDKGEEVAPSSGQAGGGRRIIVRSETSATKSAASPSGNIVDEGTNSDDILIVASKLKAYIKQRADMNTSAQVMEQLSDIVRLLCNEAILRARQEGRKTVLDRDFDFFKL